jgi:hypothetical protein
MSARNKFPKVASVLIWVLSLVVMPRPAIAQPSNQSTLADASLEELMNIEVTSVSKRAQRLSSTAASVFVIRAEDIRRSVPFCRNYFVLRLESRSRGCLAARGPSAFAGLTTNTPTSSWCWWTDVASTMNFIPASSGTS